MRGKYGKKRRTGRTRRIHWEGEAGSDAGVRSKTEKERGGRIRA